MKSIYKNLVLGIFLTVFAVCAAPTFAQDVCADIDANTALYNKYIANYAGTAAQKKIAIEAGKEYIQKYEACATVEKDAAGKETKKLTFADQIAYFKENVSVLEDSLKKEENRMADKGMYDKFNAATKAKNVAEILASGKEVIAKYPNADSTLDVAIVMASATFDEVIKNPTANTYNNDLITYAKKAIELIEAGKTSKNYGVGPYSLGTKPKALGILNYSIGLGMLSDQAKKKDAAVYFYKSSQHESVFKNVPLVYQAIGANYLDEFLKIDTERKAKLIAKGNKDDEETLAMEALQKGYADRAIEAYARAYKYAKADPKQKKEYVDTLSTRLKELYAFRYAGKALDNVDTYATTVSSKSLTEPSTAITPVKEEAPATTTPTSGTTTPATTPATTPPTNTTTKPATTPPAKPATTETDTTATTTTKTKTKKPAPKKKGTR